MHLYQAVQTRKLTTVNSKYGTTCEGQDFSFLAIDVIILE